MEGNGGVLRGVCFFLLLPNLFLLFLQLSYSFLFLALRLALLFRFFGDEAPFLNEAAGGRVLLLERCREVNLEALAVEVVDASLYLYA